MDDVKYFPYGEKELAYLRKKDKKLSAVIDRVVAENRGRRVNTYRPQPVQCA